MAGDQPAGGGCAPAGYCVLANGLLRPAVIPLAPRTGKAEARKGKNVSAQLSSWQFSSWRQEFWVKTNIEQAEAAAAA